MGWFNETVLGGDDPMDWHGIFCGIMRVDMTDDGEGYYGYAYTRELVEANLMEICERIDDEKAKGLAESRNIGWQVLGAVLLKVGAKIPELVKERITRAAREDEWAKTEPERARWMSELIDKIESARPGQRVDLTPDSLLSSSIDE